MIFYIIVGYQCFHKVMLCLFIPLVNFWISC